MAISLAVIEAGAAVVGSAAAGADSMQSGSGIELAAQGALYPSEITDQHLVGEQHSIPTRDVIKFTAVGVLYNDDLAISMSGIASYSAEELVGYPAEAGAPAVPANRFLNVAFSVSGMSETLSIGSLTVNIAPFDRVRGPAEDPKVIFRVSGRWNPTGPGDFNYEFDMVVDTFGRVWVENGRSAACEIIQQEDHILLWYHALNSDGTDE